MNAAKIIELNTARADRVRSEWRIVTPELATKWLEGNTHNRSVRDHVVARYAEDMKSGRWKQTHQGIAFDVDHTLIDGQHRLFAVISAETSVVMQVTYGLPLDSQLVVDDGLARSVVDVLRVSDAAMSGMTALHAAVARRMAVGFGRSDALGVVTRQWHAAFLRKHWEAIHFVVSQFPASKRIKGVMSAPTLAAMARAYYHENRADLVRLAAVLIDGTTTDPRDFAAIKLRNYLMTRTHTGGDESARENYAKTQRGIKAFCERKDLGRNLVPVTEDLYPLPSERR
jgi:hypothetical protein